MNKRHLLSTLFNGNVKYLNCSFSQEGEDVIVENLLNFKESGFYVDLGAFHPYRFSNTMKFYLKGWNGLNVDATPGSMKAFNKFRPRDINVEAGISSDKESELIYYVFKEGALNTFDASCLDNLKEAGYTPIRQTPVKTYTVMSILDQYIGENKKIDFMDIDIEGFDEKVISSLDFGKYRPTILMTENRSGIAQKSNSVLESNGYSLRAFTGRTAIYMI